MSSSHTWTCIRVKPVKSGRLVKTWITRLYPQSFWFTRSGLGRNSLNFYLVPVVSGLDILWEPLLTGSVVFPDPITSPHYIASGLLHLFALLALLLSLNKSSVSLNISGENPFSACLMEKTVLPIFYSSKTDKQNCTYILSVQFIEFSQIEHTHLISTQSKKQNITSPQKSLSCSFHNLNTEGNHILTSNITDLFYLFL